MSGHSAMQRSFLGASILLLGTLAAGAAPEPAPRTPRSPAPDPACVDAKNSADYVPGVDVHGRSVAPADLPGSSTDVQISTEVYAELRSANPQLRGVGVVANLPGLETRPPCPPPAPQVKR